MRIGDRRSMGDWPLRDERPDVEPERRNVPRGVTIEARQIFGRYVVKGHIGSADKSIKTAGDLQCAFHWPNAAGRKTGSWFFAAPGVVIEDEEQTVEVDQKPRDSNTTRVRTGSTNSSQVPQGGTRLVKVQVVGDAEWNPDIRYTEIMAAVPPETPKLRKGTTGTVLVTTQEKRQVYLFLPQQGDPLVSVNAAGPPTGSTIMFDTLASGQLDEERAAPAHTAWRVVPVASGCGPLTEGPVISWQLGVSGQDGLSGHGFTSAGAAAPLDKLQSEPERDPPIAPDPDDDPTRTRLREPASMTQERARAGVDGSDDPPPPSTPNSGAAQFAAITRQIADLIQEKNGLRQQLGRINSARQRAGFRVGNRAADRLNTRIAQIDAEIQRLNQGLQTKTRPTEGGEGTSVPINVHALMSSRAGGPLEVGGAVDVHRYGADVDGNPINMGHYNPNAPWYGNGLDAPMQFDPRRYSKPDGGPMRSPVHLRPDPDAGHSWPCGSAPGLWRWEAEVPAVSQPPPWVQPPPPEGQPPPGGDPPPQPPETGGSRVQPPAGEGPGTGTGGGAFGEFIVGVGGVENGGQGAGLRGGASRGLAPGDIYEALTQEHGLARGSFTAGGVALTPAEYKKQVDVGLVDSNSGWICGSILRNGEQGPTKKAKLGGFEHRAPVAHACLVAAGGVAIRPRSVNPADPDYSQGYGTTTLMIAENIRKAPTSMIIEGIGEGDGSWNGFQYADGLAPAGGTRIAPKEGGAVLMCEGAAWEDVVAGDYEPDGGTRVAPYKTRFVIPGNIAVVDYATPDNEMVSRNGARNQQIVDGMEAVLIDDGGDEDTSVRQQMDTAGHRFDGNVCLSDEFQLTEMAEPDTPSAGKGTIYIDSADGDLNIKDDGGVVTLLSGGNEHCVVDLTTSIEVEAVIICHESA